MSYQDLTIKELVNKIERREILLPEMQRKYVWKATQVRDLLDSLYRGYPSGTILTWQTDDDIATREFAIKQQDRTYSNFQLLLDGQQRLTSLSSLLRGEKVLLRNLNRPIEILFNLDHPAAVQFVTETNDDNEENLTDASEDERRKSGGNRAFAVRTKMLESLPQWVSVGEVLCDEDERKILKNAGVHDWNDKNYELYSARLLRLRKIKDYVYRVHILDNTKSYEEVTEIFVRVNSLGTKLRSYDLALAQITAKWRGALNDFESFENKCVGMSFPLDLQTILKNLVVFVTNQSKYRGLNKISKEELQAGWEQAKEGMEFAIEFLRLNVKIESPTLLSSYLLPVVVAVFGSKCGYKLSSQQESELRKWIVTANAKGRFSRGNTEEILNQDLVALEKSTSITSLFRLLEEHVGRLSISPNDLLNKTGNSALFKSMFIAFQSDGAIDWRTSLRISVNHPGNKHKLQSHHIFPRAALSKAGIEKQQINDICNLAFIGGQTNRRLGTKLPINYFPEIIDRLGETALRSQCIPLDKELWRLENYGEFLHKRRELVAERLNKLLEE